MGAQLGGRPDTQLFPAFLDSPICFPRGGIVDDDALLRALWEGWIASAGLDARSTEPLPADSPFWDAPNTIVTPHNGATTTATMTRGYRIFVENLDRRQIRRLLRPASRGTANSDPWPDRRCSWAGWGSKVSIR